MTTIELIELVAKAQGALTFHQTERGWVLKIGRDRWLLTSEETDIALTVMEHTIPRSVLLRRPAFASAASVSVRTFH